MHPSSCDRPGPHAGARRTIRRRWMPCTDHSRSCWGASAPPGCGAWTLRSGELHGALRQKMLQDELCGDRIEHGFAILPECSCPLRFRVRLGRAEALVDEGGREYQNGRAAGWRSVGSARSLCSAPSGRSTGRRPAHRLPFGDQRRCARSAAFASAEIVSGCACLSEASRGDTDSRQAEIETSSVPCPRGKTRGADDLGLRHNRRHQASHSRCQQLHGGGRAFFGRRVEKRSPCRPGRSAMRSLPVPVRVALPTIQPGPPAPRAARLCGSR